MENYKVRLNFFRNEKCTVPKYIGDISFCMTKLNSNPLGGFFLSFKA